MYGWERVLNIPLIGRPSTDCKSHPVDSSPSTSYGTKLKQIPPVKLHRPRQKITVMICTLYILALVDQNMYFYFKMVFTSWKSI